MEHQAVAELSLAPSLNAYSGSSGSFCRKRDKDCSLTREDPTFSIQTCVELQHKTPLPPEWEQCLDLHSGRMYYLNRRSLRKSWEWPMENNGSIDLELNIFTPNSGARERSRGLSTKPQANIRRLNSSSTASNIMVAVPCHNCHLLVMLCTSSPVCPNCRFVHTLPQPTKAAAAVAVPPPLQQSKFEGMRSLQTLNLLN